MGNTGSWCLSTNVRQDYNIAKIEKKFAASHSLESLDADMTFEVFHPKNKNQENKNTKSDSPNMETVRL
jgi:hypothetical protein